MIYKIVQNIGSADEYEYEYEYNSFDEARAEIEVYEQQDIKEEYGAFEYTIIDNDTYEPLYTNLKPLTLYQLNNIFS